MKYTIQVVSKLRGDGAVVVLQHGIVCPAYPTDSFHEKELHGDGTCGAEAVQCGKLTAKTSSGVADFFSGNTYCFLSTRNGNRRVFMF